ncbi:MAG: HAMP domain-containing histidine kinase [Ramlibacter sp.]|nr:HAMP domain-containing histidine kinase [Ramlibacter sp.]
MRGPRPQALRGRPGSPAGVHRRWHQRMHHRMRHSLKRRLVLLFILLALTMSGAFLFGMQKALGAGWRDAARPLLMDYVDRLAADIGDPPSIERAQALTQRLPITVRISGPRIQWGSEGSEDPARWRRETWLDDPPGHAEGDRLLTRLTADGHRIDFGVNVRPWRDHPRYIGFATLGALLLLTWLAYAWVRRLLRPLDDIRAGAQRFGRGEFGQPIPIRKADELGDLAGDVNAMAHSIHQMLEAKRGLLLAISHELRSPITRARLNTELLPEQGESAARREALLRDLQEMADLVSDLLESERLGQGHAALQLEPTDLEALVRDVVQALAEVHPDVPAVQVELAPGLPLLPLDRARVRLLLRNLLDNAVRHSAGEPRAPQLSVRALAPEGGSVPGVEIAVRDHGPGVEEAALPHLAEAFYRPDASRGRATGGVGLGLYLCKLVAQAHGGHLRVRNAKPGLEVVVTLAPDSPDTLLS